MSMPRRNEVLSIQYTGNVHARKTTTAAEFSISRVVPRLLTAPSVRSQVLLLAHHLAQVDGGQGHRQRDHDDGDRRADVEPVLPDGDPVGVHAEHVRVPGDA